MIDAQRRLGVPPTGRLDEATYLAIREFQLSSDLLVTGNLDVTTQQRLFTERLLDR